MSAPLGSIPVGGGVERPKSASQWSDYLWRPAAVLVGVPDTPAWTVLEGDDERTLFYVGSSVIELHRTETPYYRDNLATRAPLLWVMLSPTEGEPPYKLVTVTADPAEGEALTLAGDNLVDTVPMPATIADTLAAFIAEHHVEREFVKRKRDRANPEALARRTREEDRT
jgi:hypothetical protein